MNKKLKILIFVDHDIIIRNFVRNSVFDELAARHDVLFYFPEPGYSNNTRVSIDVNTLGLGERARHLEVHKKRLHRWVKLCQASRLRIRPWLRKSTTRSIIIRHAPPELLKEYKRLSLPGIYMWFKWRALRDLKLIRNRQLEAVLDAEKPDAIIHPTVLNGPYIHDLCDYSTRLGIPMVAIMNSWDNPGTKANMHLKPDWLLVWGEQTKEHAEKFLDMDPAKAVAFGVAQFDNYRNPPRMNRDDFCREHGIPSDKTVLLFAGAGKLNDEFSHLKALDDAAASGELGNTVVIYRPHPWGQGGKDGFRIIDYPWKNIRIENSMRGYLEILRDDPEAVSFPDYGNTVDVLNNIDALITPLSTIIIEAAILGKPGMCFLPMAEKDAADFHENVQLVHFKEILGMPEFVKGVDMEQLLPKTKELLERVGDAGFSEHLKERTRFFIEPFERPFGERLVDFMEEIAGPSNG
jgi:hypothetical protein